LIYRLNDNLEAGDSIDQSGCTEQSDITLNQQQLRLPSKVS